MEHDLSGADSMSQRQPDYEALRAAQARSQQADRIGPDHERYDRHEEDQ